jgi:hypothetical protein
MSALKSLAQGRMPLLVLLAATSTMSACGGSGGSGSAIDSPAAQPPPPTTGTVGLLITDKASDVFSSITFDILEAVLIGDDGQHQFFEGSEPVDLLELENFAEPVEFGQVPAGIYTKLRLHIDNLVLVRNDGEIFTPALPANGKIDLLAPDGIAVLPGRTLYAMVDMDADKAFKISGNSHNYRFRPVVKPEFFNGTPEGGLPDKLARLEGVVALKYDAARFQLCDHETPDSCIDVSTDSGTVVFDELGAVDPSGTAGFVETDSVVVIGRYDMTDDDGIVLPELVAVLIETGPADQFSGNVVSEPATGMFTLLASDGNDFQVQLQAGTLYYDVETGSAASETDIVLGTDVEIEGVATAGSPDVIRAALVLIEAEDADQLSGTITGTPDTTAMKFDVTLEDASVSCVETTTETDILFVDSGTSTVTIGGFDQLADTQVVDIFGTAPADPASGECFSADEIIVEGAPPATP